MAKIDEEREMLRRLTDWEPYLLARSGLPGPRANLTLAHAVALEAGPERILRYAGIGPEDAPTGTANEFLPVCGAIGLGRLAAEGRAAALARLRELASDPRWRIREGVAMGIQLLGDRDLPAAVEEVEGWVSGSPLERRAAIAAICEPRLLVDPAVARRAIALLGSVTASLVAERDRRGRDVRVLRQALGYCWSVAVAALPTEGTAAMERWMDRDDPDLRWVARQNLKKSRLLKAAPEWSASWRGRLGPG